MKTYKVIEVARRYNVSVFSVYAWMRDGKLSHSTEQSGMRSRKIITESDLKKLEQDHTVRITAENMTKKTHDIDPDGMAWARQYKSMMGSFPANYHGFCRGEITFEQMKAEAMRRFDSLR